MQWVSFEASQSNFDYDEFGENLKNEYDPYSSRDLFDKKKIKVFWHKKIPLRH